MQSELPAVSQHKPSVDSSPTHPTSTQHGNVFADGPVSGPHRPEATGDSTASDQLMPVGNHALLDGAKAASPWAPVSRVIQHENAHAPGKKSAELGFRVVPSANYSPQALESLPNEVLTHILSHLPPQSLSAITLVSQRFHALVTTPHAWRIAFSRFFPGPNATENGHCFPTDEVGLMSDRRFFARLTALASWRSEYILRTRLMRSLSRGRPTQFQPSKKSGTVRSSTARNGSAVATYTSQLMFPVSNIDGNFTNAEKEPTFIHGASEQGISSASDPSAVKVSTWGLSDHQVFRHFADIFPADAQYGLGSGDMVGVPNSMDVSQPYGMIYGEGCPQGRSYFISTTEQRGRFLGPSDLGSHPNLGIPAVNHLAHGVCSVWIAKASAILKTTGGLIAMMSGSSSGVLTSYALGPHPTYDGRYERGQATAKWVLSPGVPIIGIAVDDHFSPKRLGQRRIWAVALNALGEIFYLADLPRQPDISTIAKLDAEQVDELAWKTGRSVRWELIELSRRRARPDPFNRDPVDGSYSPRSSSDLMHLDENQIAAETMEIEKFLAYKPKHFRKVCEGWNMRCDLRVDFAGDDGCGFGESVVVVARGGDPDRASIRRYVRTVSTSGLASGLSTPGSRDQQPPPSLFGGPIPPSSQPAIESSPPSRSSCRMCDSVPSKGTEWRISNFIFGDRKVVEVTTSALDNSTFATLLASEDPLLAMSGSTLSSVSSSPMLPHMEKPQTRLEIPGQRARYFAVGTSNGDVFVWDVRALPSKNVDVINSIPPLRIIQTESPQVSCVALTSLYLVHGGNDGLVQAWDPLASSTRPIRTINSRFSSRARRRLVQAEASTLGVGNNFFATGAICLDPDPTVLRGMVSLGTHLRYWSYSSFGADQYKSSKRRLRRSLRGGNGAADGQRFSTSGRGAIRDFIEDERIEIERQRVADEQERTHLSERFGVDLLGPDVDEEQLLAYAQLLSQETYTGHTVKYSNEPAPASSVPSTSPSEAIGPSSLGMGEVSSSSSPYQDAADEQIDDDLAEAIRLSLLDEKSEAPAVDQTPSIPIKYAKGMRRRAPPKPRIADAESSQQTEMVDLEFAIQLSLAENQSREVDGEEWEEYPALAPTMLSSSQSSGKGKGKGKSRAI